MNVRRALLLAALFVASCADRFEPPDDGTGAGGRRVDPDSMPGVACASSLMAKVSAADGSEFCIDRFEAAVSGGELGNAAQQTDDTSTALDGSTTALATVALGVTPRGGVSWYQAKAACQNAGKRLCTLTEWERACRGPLALIYPYGDQHDETACNGFFNFASEAPLVTGSLDTCGSAFGVYDLSGNLSEWTATAVPRTPGTTIANDRAMRGGSYLGNSNALACVGEEFHAPPGALAADRGFRCCAAP